MFDLWNILLGSVYLWHEKADVCELSWKAGFKLSEKLGIEQAPSDASDNWSTGEEAVVSMFMLPWSSIVGDELDASPHFERGGDRIGIVHPLFSM